MTKETIYTELDPGGWHIIFFYKGKYGNYELYHGRYRKSVHKYFQHGKSLSRLRNSKDWRRYRFVCRLLEGQLGKEVKKIWRAEHYDR